MDALAQAFRDAVSAAFPEFSAIRTLAADVEGLRADLAAQARRDGRGLLTRSEAQCYVRRGKDAFRALCAKNRIPYVQFEPNGQVYYRTADLEAVISHHLITPEPESDSFPPLSASDARFVDGLREEFARAG